MSDKDFKAIIIAGLIAIFIVLYGILLVLGHISSQLNR